MTRSYKTNLFAIIMTEKFPNLGKEINTQVSKEHKTLNSHNESNLSMTNYVQNLRNSTEIQNAKSH